MPKKARELVPIEVQRLTKPGMHTVGGVAGLYLQVLPSGARSWVLRVMVAGKRRDMGLGGFPDVTLAQAREKAREEARKRLEEEAKKSVAERKLPEFGTDKDFQLLKAGQSLTLQAEVSGLYDMSAQGQYSIRYLLPTLPQEAKAAKAKQAQASESNVVTLWVDGVSDERVLAKEYEEQLLYRDMQNDLVQQLMRRLAAARMPDAPPPAAAPAAKP